MTARRAALVASAAALIVYLPSLQVGFLYDDLPLLVDNRAIRDLAAAGTVWRADPTRPLLAFSWALNYAAAGLDPWPWHLVNVLVHAANAALVALLAASLSRRAGHASPDVVAALAGVFFGVSPMAAETVAYVASRSSALCATFVLGALLTVLPAPGSTTFRRRAAGLLLFLLGLATKEEAVVLPGLLLLVDVSFVARGDVRATWARWRWHLPFVLTPLAGLAVRRMVAGAWLPEPVHPLGAWLLTQVSAFPWYVLRAAVPVDPAFFRGAEVAMPPSAGDVLGVLLGVAMLGWSVARARSTTPAAFAILWMAVALVPSSTLVVLKEVVVDHRAYLGGAGVAWVIGTWLAGPGRVPFAVAALLLLSGRTVHYELVMRDPVALWTDAVRRAPGSPEARTQLAEAMLQSGDPRAGYEFEEVVRLAPRDARTWANLSGWYSSIGRLREATGAMEQAVARSPRDARMRHNLAVLYEGQGRVDDAVRELRAAVAGEPPLARPRIELARLLAQRGQRDDARGLLDEAAALEVDEADVAALESLRSRLR